MAQESWQLEKQEDTSCQPPDGPSLCINNCGFFGTPATRNFCSRCFNDVVLKVKASTVAKPATEKASISDTASWIDGASVGRLADKSTSDKDAVSDTASWIDGSSVGVAYCGRPSAKSTMVKGAVSDSASRIEGFSVGIADLRRPASKSTTKKGAVSDTASRIDGSSVGIAASGSQVANTEVSSAETVSFRRDVAGGEFSATSGQQPRQQTPDRCGSCRKRVRLAGFKCRCGDLFCSLHRYSETHNCSYDYKAAGREAIAYANPVVKARKIDKI